MMQPQFHLDSELIDFLDQHLAYGFKDKSSVVREALSRLKRDLARQTLEDSAVLYAEEYASDPHLQELTETAIVEWPQ